MTPRCRLWLYGGIGWMAVQPYNVVAGNWAGIALSLLLLLVLFTALSLTVFSGAGRRSRNDWRVGQIVTTTDKGSRWRAVIVAVKYDELPGEFLLGYVELRDDEGMPVDPGTEKLVGLFFRGQKIVDTGQRWPRPLPIFDIHDNSTITEKGDIAVC